MGNIHIPRITPPKLTQQSKVYANLKTIIANTPQHKETDRTGQDLRHSNILLLNGTVFINGKKDNLPITKEYKVYNDFFSGTGILTVDEYHIKLRKDYKPVQHPP